MLRQLILYTVALWSFLIIPSVVNSQDLPEKTQHFPRERSMDVQHYRIAIEPDFDAKTIVGETQVSLTPLVDGLKTVELDVEDLDIDEITLKPGPGKESYPVTWTTEGEKLFINLDGAFSPDDNLQLAITYRAKPGTGLFFIGPNEHRPDDPMVLWSQGEDEDNHAWFPCYDFPNDKATSEVLCTVPKDYLVVSNGKLVGEKPKGDKKIVHWKQEKPHVSYLITMVAGELSKVDMGKVRGVPLSLYAVPGKEEQVRNAFETTGECLEFFEDYIGYKYAWEKYAQVAVPEFIFGGMENTSATTQTDKVLFPDYLHDWKMRSAEGLMAHELAHQWWGDVVTTKDWSHIWTNEGFATYFDALFTEHKYGQEMFADEMLTSLGGYLKGEAAFSRPLLYGEYIRPMEVFMSGHVYPKGGWVLHMLRRLVGEEDFRKGLNLYITQNAFTCVETDDLRMAMTEASGQDLEWFFDQWVRGAGHPKFEIEYVYSADDQEVELTVRQVQKQGNGIGVFRMPVDIGIAGPQGIVMHEIFIDEQEEVFRLPSADEPKTVLFDHGNWLIKELEFEKPLDELAWQITNDPDIAGKCLAVVQIARDYREDRRAFNILKKTLQNDDLFYRVRNRAIGGLKLYNNAEARDLLISVYRSNPEYQVRKAIITVMGRGYFQDDVTTDFLIEVAQRAKMDDIIGSALLSLGTSRSPRAYDVLVRHLERDSHLDIIRECVVGGLAALGDRRATPLVEEKLHPRNRYNVRTSALTALNSLMRGNPRLTEILLAATKDEKYHVREEAFILLDGSNSQKVRDHLYNIFEIEPETGLQYTQQETLEAIDGNIGRILERPLRP
jgi:aminopeptidase N